MLQDLFYIRSLGWVFSEQHAHYLFAGLTEPVCHLVTFKTERCTITEFDVTFVIVVIPERAFGE